MAAKRNHNSSKDFSNMSPVDVIRYKRKHGIDLNSEISDNEYSRSYENLRPTDAIKVKREQGVKLNSEATGSSYNPYSITETDRRARDITSQNSPYYLAIQRAKNGGSVPATSSNGSNNINAGNNRTTEAANSNRNNTNTVSQPQTYGTANAGNNRTTAVSSNYMSFQPASTKNQTSYGVNAQNINSTEEAQAQIRAEKNKNSITEEQSYANASNVIAPYIKSEEDKKLLDEYVTTKEKNEDKLNFSGINPLGFYFGNEYSKEDELKEEIIKKYDLSDEQFDKLIRNYQWLYDYENAQELKEDIDKLPSAAKGALAVVNRVTSIPASYMSLAGSLTNKSEDPELGRNFNSSAFFLSNINEATNEAIHNDINTLDSGVGKFVLNHAYDLATMMGDSFIAAGAGNIGLASYGANSYSSNLEEGLNRGLPENQAQAYATVMGITEIATEKIPFDHLSDLLKHGASKEEVKGLLSPTVKAILVQFGEEGGEEVANDIVDDIADGLINGDQSKNNIRLQYYMSDEYAKENNNGVRLTQDEAMALVVQERALEYLQDGVMGGLSGAGSAGLAIGSYNVATGIDNAISGQNLVKNENLVNEVLYNPEHPDYISTELDDYDTEEDYQQAQQAREQLLNASKNAVIKNQKPKLRESAKVYTDAVKALESRNDNSSIPEEYRNRKTSEDETLDALDYASDPYKLALAAESVSRMTPAIQERYAEKVEQLKDYNFTQEQIDNAITVQKAYKLGLEQTKVTDEDLKSIPEAYREKVKLANQEAYNKKFIEAHPNAVIDTKTGEAIIPQSVEIKDNSLVVVDQEGNEHTEYYNPLTSAVDKYADKYNMSPAQEKIALEFALASSNSKSADFNYSLNQIRNAASLGIKGWNDFLKANTFVSKLIENNRIDSKKAQELYESIYDATKTADAQKAKSATVKNEGKVTDTVKEMLESENKAFAELVQAYAKKTGTNIVAINYNNDTRAAYIPEKGEIALNKANAHQLWISFIHEAVGEKLQRYANAEDIRDIQNEILNYLEETLGESDYNRLIDSYQFAYRQSDSKVDQNKTRREAANEMANDFMAGLFSSEKGLNEFIDWVTDAKTANQQVTILQKIKDMFDSFLKYIKDFFANGKFNAAETAALDMAEDRAEALRQKIIKALDKAIENRNAQVGQQGESAPRNSIKISYENQIDELVANTFNPNSYLVLRENLPEAFIKFAGLINAPVVMNYRKAKISMDESGKYSDHYHNLGPEIMKQIPKAMEDPEMILRLPNGRINAILKIVDKKGRTILISLEMDKGKYIDKKYAKFKNPEQAVLITAFGAKPKYIEKLIDEGKILYPKEKASSDVHEGSQRANPSIKDAILNNSVAPSTDNSIDKMSKNSEKTVNTAQDIADAIPTARSSKQVLDNPTSQLNVNGNLIVVHNLTADKLLKVLTYNGIPMPSLAVTKAEIGHTNFGDITLVFNKDTIDPKKNKKNHTYSADVWSPVFPQIDYDINNDVIAAVDETVRKADIPDWIMRNATNKYSDMERKLKNSSLDEIIDDFKKDVALQAVYLSAIQKIPVELKQTEQIVYMNEKTIEKAKFIQSLGNIDDLYKMPFAELEEKVGLPLIKHINEQRKAEDENAKLMPETLEYIENSKLAKMVLRHALEDTREYERTGGKEINIVEDTEAEKNFIKENIDTPAYEKWIEDSFKDVVNKTGIWNNKEYIDARGNRRTFDQLHYAVTAENIVKSMLGSSEDVRNASGFNHGIKGIRSVVADDFESIDAIRNASNRLTNIDSGIYDDMLEKLDKRHAAVMDEIINQSNRTGNRFMFYDSVDSAIMESAANPSVKNIINTLKEYSWNITEEQAKEIADIISEVEEMPVNMFEAKPQRVVAFDEILRAVIPSDTESMVKKALDNAGISYVEYEKGNEDQRKDLISNTENARFSITVYGDASPYADSINQTKIVEEVLSTINNNLKGTSVSMKFLDKTVDEIIKKYQADVDADELKMELSQFIAHMTADESVNYDQMMNYLLNVGDKIIKSSNIMDEEEQRIYDETKSFLKGYSFKLSKEEIAELKYHFGDWNTAFGVLNQAGINLDATNGTSIDRVFSELQQGFLETSGINLEKYNKPSDQIIGLVDVMSALEPKHNAFEGANALDNALDVAVTIIDSYYAMADYTKELSIINKTEKGKQRIQKALSKETAKVRENLRSQFNKYKETKEEAFKQLVLEKNQIIQQQQNQLRAQEAQMKKWDEAAKDQVKQQKLTAEQMKRTAKIQALEAVQSYKEAQERAKQIENIRKSGIRMIKWLAEPTEKQHIPNFLQKPLGEFLAAIDFLPKNAKADSKSTLSWQQRMQTLRDTLIKVREAEIEGEDSPEAYFAQSIVTKDLLAMMDDFLGKESWDEFTQSYVTTKRAAKKVSMLEAKELATLNKIMSGLSAAINNMNKTYANEYYKEVDELAAVSYDELQELKKDKVKYNRFTKALKNFGVAEKTPVYFFDELGKGAKSIFDELQQGWNLRTNHIREASEHIAEFKKANNITDKEMSKWGSHVNEFKLSEGTIELTDAQIMSLYRIVNRKQGRPHVMLGGIRPADTTIGRNTTHYNKAVHINAGDYQKIISVLSEDQIKMADEMQKYMATECAKWGNRVAQKMFGYKKFEEEDYFPLRTDAHSRAVTNVSDNNVGYNTIKNSSFTKNIVPNANNAVMLEDIFDVFTGHVEQMANYDGFVMPIADAMRWFNYSEKVVNATEEGLRVDVVSNMQEAIEGVLGTAGTDYFRTFIKNINGIFEGKGGEIELANKLAAGYKAQAVMANLRVALQQPMAIARAIDRIEDKYILKAVALPTATLGIAANKWAKKAQKNSALAFWKAQGYYETMIGQSMKSIITGEQSFKDWINEKGGWLAGKMDDITWGVIYRASELKVSQEHPELAYDSEEYTKEVVKQFEEVINYTQVVDTIFHKSEYMRSKSAGTKMLTAFMAEPTLTLNMARHRVREAGIEISNGNKAAAIKTVAKLMKVLIANDLLLAFAQSLMDALRDDDPDKDLYEKFLKYMFGLSEDMSIKDILTSNVLDNVNPLNWLPLTKEIMSYIQGYDASNMYVDAIYTVGDSVSMLADMITTGEVSKTGYGALYTIAKGVSQTFGIPISNTMREFKTLYNNINNLWGGSDLYTSKRMQKQAATAPSKKELKVAIKEGNLKDINNAITSVYNQSIEAGKDESGAWTAVRDELKEHFLSEAAEAQSKEEITKLINRYTTFYCKTKKKKGDSYVNYSEKEARGKVEKWYSDNF